MFTVPYSKIDLRAESGYARRASGKSYARQLWEIARLMAGPNKLSPWHYYRYRLWDPTLSQAQKEEYIADNSLGWFLHEVADPAALPPMRDKLRAQATLEKAGFRTPKILAVYRPDESSDGPTPLTSIAELTRFLRDPVHYPLFCKPVWGHKSGGAALLAAYDEASDALRKHDGELIGVSQFAASLEDYCREPSANDGRRTPSLGYVFQDVLTNRPDVAEMCGATLATVRVSLGIDDRGPHILGVTWKFPSPGEPADNLSRPGNCWAGIDPSSGVILRVGRGDGCRMELFENHPYTGAPLRGKTLPSYAEVRDIALRGATLFPTARFQSWDVAICTGGPVVIEANYGGGFAILQLGRGSGLADARFREFRQRARRLNRHRRFVLPVSWNADESIWRLRGAWETASSLLFKR